MQKVVGIRFDEASKIYYFETPSFVVNIDDKVVVETANGLELANVCELNHEIDEYDLSSPLKPIIRIATDKDYKKQKENIETAQKNIGKVKDKVKEMNLPMTIVNMQYTLDGNKIVINFVSDDRVDFRDLLRELAAILKARIELRQIGIRDEVKMIGGLGPCGQPCCCKRFLNDFEHVSVKMAKNQGLSLNPTKISGLCGRLMCCLEYENKFYAETLKRMPKVGSQIVTPEGTGTVTYNDILREKVTVRFYAKDDSTTLKIFDLDVLNANVEKEPNKSVEAKKEEIKPATENKTTENKPEPNKTNIQNNPNKQSNNNKRKFYFKKKKGENI